MVVDDSALGGGGRPFRDREDNSDLQNPVPFHWNPGLHFKQKASYCQGWVRKGVRVPIGDSDSGVGGFGSHSGGCLVVVWLLTNEGQGGGGWGRQRSGKSMPRICQNDL